MGSQLAVAPGSDEVMAVSSLPESPCSYDGVNSSVVFFNGKEARKSRKWKHRRRKAVN